MLARLYHAHHSRHMEDLPFWLDLAQHTGGPLLELGCGSGRLLLPLAGQGHRVVGLERDPAMLAVLEEQITPRMRLRSRVRIVQGDMAAFDLGERFNLILLPCNTYSTLESNQRRDMLECVRRHLLPGGLFALSLPNPALLRRLPPRLESEVEDIFPHPLDGEPVQVSSGWERTAGRLTIHWHYDHLLPDGRVERLSTQTVHILDTIEAIFAELESAGLQPADQYGDFDRTLYTPDSPYLILTATPRF